MNICLPNKRPISDKLTKRVKLYFGFKTSPVRDLAPLHMLNNVSELAPLLQECATLLCSSSRLGSIDLVLLLHNLWMKSVTFGFVGQKTYKYFSV